MKTKSIVEKINLHPRNLHRLGYDFEKLVSSSPALQFYIIENKYQPGTSEKTIDFSNPNAVKELNKALLKAYYGIDSWDIPENYLCPPIPGRVDYIHYIADLLASTNHGIIPQGEQIQALDIGIGANCIYPILGNSVYGWSFVGSDIEEQSLQNCKIIIENNPQLIDYVSLHLQTESRFIFKNCITTEDRFAFTICNPPFHNSKEEAVKASIRKWNNLGNKKKDTDLWNFGGQKSELWCPGGELGFLTQMVYESAKYPMQCLWFTSLVSKKENLPSLYKTLNKVNVASIKTIDMAQGQKKSRIIAWTFQTKAQQNNWKF
jgi:23S rRNA (adenine1618-N6)-methyltransferase